MLCHSRSCSAVVISAHRSSDSCTGVASHGCSSSNSWIVPFVTFGTCISVSYSILVIRVQCLFIHARCSSKYTVSLQLIHTVLIHVQCNSIVVRDYCLALTPSGIDWAELPATWIRPGIYRRRFYDRRKGDPIRQREADLTPLCGRCMVVWFC